MSLGIETLTFAACINTHSKMSMKKGKKIKLLAGVTMTISGVVRLVELQEQGYAYIRPCIVFSFSSLLTQ
jgi:intracellular sulfur oxidation DsrE/DsrF family protein